MRTKTVRTKTAIPKEGIFIRKNSKGFYATIKQNKFKLAMIGGYNRKQSVHDGLSAIQTLLSSLWMGGGKYKVIDLTKKK